MRLTKRKLISGIGAIVTGGVGVYATSQTGSGLSVGINELSIPDNRFGSNLKVVKIPVSVSGELSIDTTQAPTKVVLRFRLAHNDVTQQLTAKEISNLNTDMEQSYSFAKTDILGHPELTPSDFQPSTIGDSLSEELTFKIKLEAYRDGKLMGSSLATDTSKLTVEKTSAQISASINGTGTTSFVTETP